MNIVQKKRIVLIFLMIILVILNCGEKIPIKEMSLAKMEITRALSVKAEKYAPDEISEAKKRLLECHDFIKNDQLDKARDSAVDSHSTAIDAFNISIPLLANDTIEDADKKIKEAEEVYSEVLSKDEYNNSEVLLLEARNLFEEKKYYDSYLKALESSEQAELSRNIAMGRKGLLEDAIAEIKVLIEDGNKFDVSKYAPEKIGIAIENVEIAENSLSNSKLKAGFTAIEIAKINADEAYLIALKGYSNESISKAELILEDAKNSEGASIAREELAGAIEALTISKSQYAESKFIESLTSSDESKRMSYIVINTKKVIVEEVAKEEEKIEVEMDDVVEEKKVEKEYQIYRVRYIPNRRDCLWRIADRFYKNPLLWKNIFKANRDKIHNPDLIWPDMELKIPILKKSKGNKEKNKRKFRKEEEAIKDETREDQDIT